MTSFNNQQIEEINNLIRKSNQMGLSNPISTKVPPHKHDGVDNIKIPDSSVIPSTAVMGKISFARNTTYTLLFSSNNPTRIDFNGVAIQTSSDNVLLLNSGVSSGYTYTQISFTSYPNGWTGTSGVYIVTFSNEESRATNFINGSNTITWSPPLTSSVSSTASYTTATSSALVVGSATLFKTFAFQPLTTSTVKVGGTPYPIKGILAQCSTNLYIDTSSLPNLYPHVDANYIVNVFAPSGHIITGQLINFTGTSVDFVTTNLVSGWKLVGNFIIT